MEHTDRRRTPDRCFIFYAFRNWRGMQRNNNSLNCNSNYNTELLACLVFRQDSVRHA